MTDEAPGGLAVKFAAGFAALAVIFAIIAHVTRPPRVPAAPQNPAPTTTTPIAESRPQSGMPQDSASTTPAGINVYRVALGNRLNSSSSGIVEEMDGFPTGPTRVVAQFFYENANIGDSYACRLEGQSFSTGRFAHRAGSVTCWWNVVPPGTMTVALNVNGVEQASRQFTIGPAAASRRWSGSYLHDDGRVDFTMETEQTGNVLRGRITEDIRGRTRSAMIEGEIDGDSIRFTKTYSDNGDVVTYAGSIDRTTQRVEGRWTAGGRSGSFEMAPQ